MGLGDVQDYLAELEAVKKWTDEVEKILKEADEKLSYAYSSIEDAQMGVSDDSETWSRLGEAIDYIDDVARRLEDI